MNYSVNYFRTSFDKEIFDGEGQTGTMADVISESNLAEQFGDGYSIQTLDDLKDEVMENEDMSRIYMSMKTADLLSVPQIARKCRECNPSEKCCSGCEIHTEMAEFNEVIGETFDLCYNCPEYNATCTGFDDGGCMYIEENMRIKDIHIPVSELLTMGIIDKETMDTLKSNHLHYISCDNYELLQGLVSDTFLTKISDYAYRKVVSIVTGKHPTSSSISYSDVEVKATRTRSNSILGNMRVGSKLIKFFVKEKYVSVSNKIDDDVLDVLETKLKDMFDITLPEKVYGM